ncbi:hypothetical protein GTA08_BOTSDO06276 [Botryosphaeria dothidea]|uniref:Uncharacterized protein n=1 Tax=Botryosphaeria dothidea TaxID=55169 RepID=A0A8H4IKB3_9PEZI|nr:hypothetical protein GTA08_BOTSDO10223 [Botryosphaeria dothidea]KAF4305177.1 hypothetical protein GTA08_BOTSDO06276 [Botryosphaeria dothidea]
MHGYDKSMGEIEGVEESRTATKLKLQIYRTHSLCIPCFGTCCGVPEPQHPPASQQDSSPTSTGWREEGVAMRPQPTTSNRFANHGMDGPGSPSSSQQPPLPPERSPATCESRPGSSRAPTAAQPPKAPTSPTP